MKIYIAIIIFQVFVAWCTPLAMPENREIVVQGATNVFTTVHSLDMKIIEADDK